MSRPSARDNDAMTGLLRSLKAQVAALAGRASLPIGKRWRIQENPATGDLVALAPATGQSVVLGTLDGQDCGRVLDCLAESLRPELEFDGGGLLGIRVSADAGNALTIGSDGGLYVPVSTGTGGGTSVFKNSTVIAIPDSSGCGPNGVAESPIVVSGLTGNGPIALVIKVDITHSVPAQLIVELIDSAGGVHILRDRVSDGAVGIHQSYVIDASGVPANGTWKLHVEDATIGSTGTIDSWQLTFQG